MKQNKTIQAIVGVLIIIGIIYIIITSNALRSDVQSLHVPYDVEVERSKVDSLEKVLIFVLDTSERRIKGYENFINKQDSIINAKDKKHNKVIYDLTHGNTNSADYLFSGISED